MIFKDMKYLQNMSFICDTCNGTFPSSHGLIMHKVKAHKLYPSRTCYKCNKTFSRIARLHEHNAKYHNEEQTITHTNSHNDTTTNTSDSHNPVTTTTHTNSHNPVTNTNSHNTTINQTNIILSRVAERNKHLEAAKELIVPISDELLRQWSERILKDNISFDSIKDMVYSFIQLGLKKSFICLDLSRHKGLWVNSNNENSLVYDTNADQLIDKIVNGCKDLFYQYTKMLHKQIKEIQLNDLSHIKLPDDYEECLTFDLEAFKLLSLEQENKANQKVCLGDSLKTILKFIKKDKDVKEDFSNTLFKHILSPAQLIEHMKQTRDNITSEMNHKYHTYLMLLDQKLTNLEAFIKLPPEDLGRALGSLFKDYIFYTEDGFQINFTDDSGSPVALKKEIIVACILRQHLKKCFDKLKVIDCIDLFEPSTYENAARILWYVKDGIDKELEQDIYIGFVTGIEM